MVTVLKQSILYNPHDWKTGGVIEMGKMGMDAGKATADVRLRNLEE